MAGGKVLHTTTVSSMGGVFSSFVPEQVHIYAAINAVGGGAVVAGAGGTLSFNHLTDGSSSSASSSTALSLLLAGAVDARGGTGGTSQGAGGTLTFHGFGDVELRAPVLLTGGATTNANPTSPASLRVDTTGTINSMGALTVNGTDQGVLVVTSRAAPSRWRARG